MPIDIAAIAITNGRSFIFELKCLLHGVGGEQVEGLTLKIVHSRKRALGAIADSVIECSQELAALRHLVGRNLLGKRQVADAKAG